MPSAIGTVAIFDRSDDTVEMIATLLRYAGFKTLHGHASDLTRGLTDVQAWVGQHDPQVILWDLSPPYETNWTFVRTLRRSPLLHGRGFVLTTTHKPYVVSIAKTEPGTIDVIEKPYDLDVVLRAVRKALPARL